MFSQEMSLVPHYIMYNDESWSLGKSVMGVGRAIKKDM